jgi:coenzyme PQQ precursor peptide PqqA
MLECGSGRPLDRRPDWTRQDQPDYSNEIYRNTDGGNTAMTWTTPAYEDLRLGFEINLYINNR